MGKIDLADKLDGARTRVEAETPVEDRGLAKFARLTRKDARVRADQDAALTALAKRLMRRRPVKAERITENTLIRVAIDLLLTHADELSGSTENELRTSVTSGLSNSRRSEVAKSRTGGLPTFSTSGVPNADTSTDPNRRSSGHPDLRSSEAADSDAADARRPAQLVTGVQPTRSRSDAPGRTALRDGARKTAAPGTRGARPPSDPLAALTPSVDSTGVRR